MGRLNCSEEEIRDHVAFQLQQLCISFGESREASVFGDVNIEVGKHQCHYAEVFIFAIDSTPSKYWPILNFVFNSHRLADRLVFWVIQGKTVDEIYLDEKKRIEATRNAAKKLSGYIGPDEYALQRERFNDAPTSSIRLSMNVNSSQKTFVDAKMASENSIGEQKPLTNSSSKNNMTSNALRENHDSKSAQKNSSGFSGRNQKNLSPYNDKARSASNLNKANKVLVNSSVHSSLMKVKRQISFDNWTEW